MLLVKVPLKQCGSKSCQKGDSQGGAMYVKFLHEEILYRIYNWHLSEEGTEDWLHTLGDGNPPKPDVMAGGQPCTHWESLSVYSEWISWCINMFAQCGRHWDQSEFCKKKGGGQIYGSAQGVT